MVCDLHPENRCGEKPHAHAQVAEANVRLYAYRQMELAQWLLAMVDMDKLSVSHASDIKHTLNS